jgi:hypothetical protein
MSLGTFSIKKRFIRRTVDKNHSFARSLNSGTAIIFGVTIAVSVLCSTALANPITGFLSVSLGQVGVSAFGTDFYSYNSSPDSQQCDLPGTAPGCFVVQSNSTGNFQPYIGDPTTSNLIDDLTNPAEPLSGALAVPNFISIGGGAPGGVTFNLVDIFQGTGGSCGALTVAQLEAPGTTCTIYVNYGGPFGTEISPYTLKNDNTLFGTGNAVTTSVSMTQLYNAYTGSPFGGETPYYGIFTTDATQNIAQILTAIEGGQVLSTQWQATFAPIPGGTTITPPAPEPASLLLASLGIFGIMYRVRKRAN